MNENGAKRTRRDLPAEMKWQALQERRHAQVPVSQVCAKYDIRPTQLYQWEKTAERAALEALRGRKRGRKKVSPREEELLAEIVRLREVVAEVTSENLQLKKGRWR
jgi:transposase-like protein